MKVPSVFAGEPGTPQEHTAATDILFVYLVFITLALLGALGSILYAVASAHSRSGFLTIIGGALLTGCASGFFGALIGFLFAIPRSRQEVQNPQPTTQQIENGGPRRLSDYAANTNLEQISDWLTKILVGIGLVQFDAMSGRASRAADVFAQLLGAGLPARAAAIALMTYFSLWGFFLAYLITRLWLPKALSRAEREEEVRKREVEKDAALRAVEGAAYTALYEPEPAGFTRAIEMIEQHLAKPGARASGQLYLQLASAYGQKHAFVKKTEGNDAALKLVPKVVDAVGETLRRSPELRPTLVQLYRGDDPKEDDLATLKPSLDELLGAK